MELSGKRIAVLAEDRYQELELWYPLLRLREAGADVTVIGREKGKVHVSERNYEVKADIAASELGLLSGISNVILRHYSTDGIRQDIYSSIMKSRKSTGWFSD